MGKCKRFEVKGFLNFLLEAEIRAVPKTWKKWIFTAPEKYGKTQTFHIYGFLEYFGWSRNPYNSQIMGKVNLLNTGKVWENIEVSQILHYLTDLELMRTHAIPNVSECAISHNMEMFCGKPYPSQAVVFLTKLEVITKPKQSTEYG